MNSICVIIAHGPILWNDGVYFPVGTPKFVVWLAPGHSVGIVDVWADSCRGLLGICFEL